MTVFDLIALAVIAVSALSGLARGAVRELVGLFAFAFSALATVAFLPATAPIARHFVHSGWLGAAVAALVTFVIVFIFLRVLAGTLTARLDRGSMLGSVNRFGGLVFGGLRGLLLLGLLALVFDKATPQSFKPGWIVDSASYPIASGAGQVLAKLLPRGAHAIGAFTPDIGKAVNAQSGDDAESGAEAYSEAPPAPLRETPSTERAKHANHGYTKHARDSVDALVERSN